MPPRPIHPLFVNRCAILLRAKAPYIAWANGLDDDGPRYEEVAYGEGGTVYLAPDLEVIEDVHRYLRKHVEFFFEEQLNNWCIDPDAWPPVRTWKVFKEWFDIGFHSMVVDTSHLPLIGEDWDDPDTVERLFAVDL